MTSLLKVAFSFALLSLVAVVVRSAWAADAKETSVLRHVVFFKFKPDAGEAKVKEVVEEFRKLPGKIDSIKGFEWGTDVGVENLSKGFTHCFFLTFADEKGRDAYLPHAAHQEFVGLVKPVLDDVCVVDYWTKN